MNSEARMIAEYLMRNSTTPVYQLAAKFGLSGEQAQDIRDLTPTAFGPGGKGIEWFVKQVEKTTKRKASMKNVKVASELVKLAKALTSVDLKMSDLNHEEKRLIDDGALGWGLLALEDLWADGITIAKRGKESPELEKKAKKILEDHYETAKDKGVVFVEKK